MSHKLLSNKNQIIKQIITLIQITKENRLYIYQMVDNIAMTPIHIKDSKIKYSLINAKSLYKAKTSSKVRTSIEAKK